MLINRKEYCQEKKVIILIFVIGFIMSFLVPVWQTPDEYAHLNMIGNSLKIDNFADNIMDSIGIENGRIEHNYEEKISIEEEKIAMFKAPTYNRMEMLPQGIQLSVIKHLPAALGIMLGIIIGIPAIWVMHLGELFSLIFYSIICYYALKKMPIKREVLGLLMLFPMALQQAGSINYDAVLLPLCFLFIAYVFELKFEKKEIGLREVLFLLLIWCIISYIKMPYVFLLLLILIVPLDKINIQIGSFDINEKFIKKYRIPFLGLFLIIILCLGYLFRNNLWIQLVYGFVVEWRRGLYLLFQTGKTWIEFLEISTVGNFGWLDTPMSINVVTIVFLFVLFWGLLKAEGMKYRLFDYIIIVATIISLCLFTTIALTNHTIMITLYGDEFVNKSYNIRTALYQIPYIGGLQGRYYLPVVPLFFIPLPGIFNINIKYKYVVIVAGEIILYIYVFYLLICRYWLA